jgi:hypothetical protein
MYVVRGPYPCKFGGKFYNVSEDGRPIILTTDASPLRTYGISKYGSVYLYASRDSADEGIRNFLRSYARVEEEILSSVRGAGESSLELKSRISQSKKREDVTRIVTKFEYRDPDRTLVSPMIKNLNGSDVDVEALRSGKKYDIYPVIEISSVYVSKSKGIFPQLKITEAYLLPVEQLRKPILNACDIIKRYERKILGFRIEDAKDDDEKK